MKFILFVSVLLVFSFKHLSAQAILAGQTEGPYIHYSDIEDINLEADSSYAFDFDQDGTPDLNIACFWYTTHVGYEKGVLAEPLNNTQLCNYPENPGWSIKYDTDASIGLSCYWNLENSILREHLWSIMTGESFFGNWNYSSGYLGFRICKTTDTLIGWIGMKTTSEESVSIYDYAVYSVHLTSEIVTKPDWDIEYNSVVTDKLNIQITFPSDQNLEYYCLNSLGQVMAAGELRNESTNLDLSAFPAGIYFCRISCRSQGGYYKVLKFVKK
jgi:hypothetical protein